MKKRNPNDQEAKDRWGHTYAYKEYVTHNLSADAELTAAEGLNAIFVEFAKCMQLGENARSAAAQSLVAKLQQYITDHFYTCTKRILAGLGQMYLADARFTENIDKHGVGTAAFVSAAIAYYAK